MKMRHLILITIFSICATHASAGFISIRSEPSVFLEDGKVRPVIKLENLGDEAAYDLSVAAVCADREAF